jgi:hypothetical protein
LHGYDDIKGDLDSILLNLVASTIPKWRTFKLLWWMQLLDLLVDLYEILYGGDYVEVEIGSILLNLVASTIPKWRTFKLPWWRSF